MKGYEFRPLAQHETSRSLRKRPKTMRRASILAAGMVTCWFAPAVLLPAASASASSAAASPLKQGLKFYDGKTITFIMPTAAGAAFDQIARIATPYMASYLHATINIENVPLGGEIPGQDELASAVPNGLTIGMLGLGTDVSNILQGLAGVNFNPEREAMIGGPTNTPVLIVTSPTSPYKSLGDLQTLSASNPPRVLIQTASSGTISTRLWLKAFGIKSVFVYGFANSTSVVAGFLDGDGNLQSEVVSANGPLVKAGQAVPIYTGTTIKRSSPFYSLLAGVPNLSVASAKYEVKTPLAERSLSLFTAWQNAPGTAYAAPSKTPNDEVVALRAATQYAFSRAAVTQELVTQGNPTGYFNGPAEKAGYVKDLGAVKGIRAVLGITAG